MTKRAREIVSKECLGRHLIQTCVPKNSESFTFTFPLLFPASHVSCQKPGKQMPGDSDTVKTFLSFNNFYAWSNLVIALFDSQDLPKNEYASDFSKVLANE